jgi:serine/threonine protein kinase
MSGLPVPDALLFDDLSSVSFDDYQSHSSPPHQSLPRAREIANRFGFSLVSEDPLRSSSNSSVYIAKSPLGEDGALKISPHCRRLRREFVNRQVLGVCPFLVTSYDFFDASPYAMVEMELCAGGDLQSVKLSEPETWRLCLDVAMALDHIHSLGFLHLDVSPRNILRAGDGFQLADFGTLAPEGECSAGLEGSGPYASPEIIAAWSSAAPGVSFSSDIFSFGVCLVETTSGFFAPRADAKKYDQMRNGELKLGSPDYPCDYDRNLVAMINAMLARDTKQRPTTGMIIDVAKWGLRRFNRE